MRYTNIEKTNLKFVGYAFNTSLSNLSVAIYKSEKGNVLCRVEKDGEPVGGYTEQTYSERNCPDGIEHRLVADFVSNEDDIYYNQTRALSEVIDGLYIGDLPSGE